MTQTRGRPTQALLSGGGPIRDVTTGHIKEALEAGGYAPDETLAHSLHALFSDRIVAVDAPPAAMRDNRKKVERIQRAACELSAAIRDHQDSRHIMREVAASIHQTTGTWPDRTELSRWLVRLEGCDALFKEARPAVEYRSAIRRAHDTIKGAGQEVRPYSRFLAFLNALDELFPGLAWPPSIDRNSTKARTRRIEEALKD